MGIFIITLAILSLAVWIFIQVWKLALRFFYYAVLGAVEIAKKIIVAAKRFGKVIFLMYKRHKNGKIYKVEYTEEELEPKDVPEGLLEELETHEEVLVKKDDISPNEF